MFKQLKGTHEFILEITLKSDFKIIDQIEFDLNKPKDKIGLLLYIRQKLGLVEEIKDDISSLEFW